MAVETEVKFRVESVAALEARLLAVGFHLETPRSFESNVLFDTADRALRAKRSILRIRRYDGKWVLTHKRLPETGASEDRHKHRIETEMEVSDGEALGEVLRSLGYQESFRYEKWRAEWTDGVGQCVVDETPLGVYAELEGDAEWIDQACERLAVMPEALTTASYGRLFEQWREKTGNTATDMTFVAVGAAVSAVADGTTD